MTVLVNSFQWGKLHFCAVDFGERHLSATRVPSTQASLPGQDGTESMHRFGGGRGNTSTFVLFVSPPGSE